MTVKKLKFMPYAQAHVEVYNDGSVNLISYTTLVCSIDANGWLFCNGTYSATTRRHIGAFMKEYGNGFDYYAAKDCYTKNRILNIETAEIIEIPRG